MQELDPQWQAAGFAQITQRIKIGLLPASHCQETEGVPVTQGHAARQGPALPQQSARAKGGRVRLVAAGRSAVREASVFEQPSERGDGEVERAGAAGQEAAGKNGQEGRGAVPQEEEKRGIGGVGGAAVQGAALQVEVLLNRPPLSHNLLLECPLLLLRVVYNNNRKARR